MIEKVTARSAIHGWQRYEILREFHFLKKTGQIRSTISVLIFDLYARERLKSRPAFAADRSAVITRTAAGI